MPPFIIDGKLRPILDSIANEYRTLLESVDFWMEQCRNRYPDHIRCSPGCSGCCRGLFDITLLDAYLLNCGVHTLDSATAGIIMTRSRQRLADLLKTWPDFVSPWILNRIPEDKWELMMPEDDETSCPLLSDDGRCLVYQFRPMTCRLHGIPLIDDDGEIMDEKCCSLNFAAHDPLKNFHIRFGFKDIFSRELLLFRELTRCLTGSPHNELDTIIPAAVVMDFSVYQNSRI